MSYLELHSVSKIYGEGASEVHALTDVSLAVEAGELVAVMGTSGSGKTVKPPSPRASPLRSGSTSVPHGGRTAARSGSSAWWRTPRTCSTTSP